MFLPLYWLYLWQIKEYRVGRMQSHIRLLSSYELLKAFLWGQWRRPHFTSKLLMITGVTGLLGLSLVVVIALWSDFSFLNTLLGIGLAWLLSPLLVSLSVGLVALIERPIKQRVISNARRKSETFFKDTLVIGITGSYGKTTTKEFLKHIMSVTKDIAVTPEHVNQTLPMAQFINNLERAPEILIVEYASYGIGNIDYDAKNVISPDWAILTGIAPQHLELFGSLENIVTAKLELVGNVPSDAPVFFNADDARLSNAIANLNRENTVGYSAADITSHMDTLSWKDELKGKLLQKMFATNVAAAIAVAKACDISDADIVRGIEDISWLPRTLEPRSLQHFELIDDSYSCNPYGFEKLIDFVSDLDFSQKVLITSGVIELGAESDRINSALSQLAQKVFDVVFITSSSLSTAWGADEENNVIHSSVEDMLPLIKEKTQKKSLIVLEGRVPSMVRNYILDDLSQQIA